MPLTNDGHNIIFKAPDPPFSFHGPDLVRALQEIALGRKDGGRPLAAEVARQKARRVLTDHGIGWSEARKS